MANHQSSLDVLGMLGEYESIAKLVRLCSLISEFAATFDVITNCFVRFSFSDIWPVIKRMTVIAKRELMFLGSFGIAMFLAGLTFISRRPGGSAGQEMCDAVLELKNKNTKLWVFPEGTRRNTGEIHEFKKGAFYAAVQAQVSIQPVVFSSYKNFLNAKEKFFGRGQVTITALPEISTEGMTVDDVDDLIARTRNAMMETFKKTTKDMEDLMVRGVDGEDD